MTQVLVDEVLSARRPAFSEFEAAAIARDVFGVDGTATEVPSERDQAFLINGDRPTVLKISNAAEDPAQLDLEALAAQHIVSVDPALPVAQPWRVPGAALGSDGPEAYRAAVVGEGATHHARLYDRLPGRSVHGSTLTDDAVREWAATAARVGRALRSFWHASARRVMLWDVQHALLLRPLLDSVGDDDLRELVARALDRYERVVTPIWPTLGHQVIHTDMCASNFLVDDAQRPSAIIDFGDASWSALVVDLAAILESVTEGREEDVDDWFRVCRIALDAYESVTPLAADERAIVGELVAARMCAGIVIPASRAGLYANPTTLMSMLRGQAAKVLRMFDALGWDEVQRRLGGRAPGQGSTVQELVARRARAVGPALTPPTYRQPLHLVRGDGVWLFDADGRRYLDAYNNVPVVGHGHPRVVEATVRQARRLNTNMRYLHETALEVAERLISSIGGALDTVMFVNSGSEANDLAWRIARAATGSSGGITTDWAYHGITDAIHNLTPEEWGSGSPPEHVRTWRPPDSLRGFDGSVDDCGRALSELAEAGHRPAAAILDSILTSDGIIEMAPAVAVQLVQLTHDAGALWIADEVQSGYGRTGAAMWGYQRLGITPDLVTLGKPMGNGHPVAAVVTRREIAERFSPDGEFFSTFGGNPVAMAAALAVLEVIDDERIVAHAADIGAYLATTVRDATKNAPKVAEVRSVGMAIGVEIVEPDTTNSDRTAAKEIVERMRSAGILIGTTGRHSNVLKIRPPLIFNRTHADQVAEALASIVSDPT